MHSVSTAIRLTLIAVILAGCEPRVQYVTAPLDRPPRPTLPRISDAELECLTLPTYQKLFERYTLVKDYAIKLETIIDSTRPDAKADESHLGESENPKP